MAAQGTRNGSERPGANHDTPAVLVGTGSQPPVEFTRVADPMGAYGEGLEGQVETLKESLEALTRLAVRPGVSNEEEELAAMLPVVGALEHLVELCRAGGIRQDSERAGLVAAVAGRLQGQLANQTRGTLRPAAAAEAAEAFKALGRLLAALGDPGSRAAVVADLVDELAAHGQGMRRRLRALEETGEEVAEQTLRWVPLARTAPAAEVPGLAEGCPPGDLVEVKLIPEERDRALFVALRVDPLTTDGAIALLGGGALAEALRGLVDLFGGGRAPGRHVEEAVELVGIAQAAEGLLEGHGHGYPGLADKVRRASRELGRLVSIAGAEGLERLAAHAKAGGLKDLAEAANELRAMVKRGRAELLSCLLPMPATTWEPLEGSDAPNADDLPRLLRELKAAGADLNTAEVGLYGEYGPAVAARAVRRAGVSPCRTA